MPPEVDNPRLLEIFQEDQTEREKVYDDPRQVSRLKEMDTARRKRIIVMMELGEVKTKNDFYHAAVLFQHGDKPEDFLAAHRLSALAAILGHKTARWLMAASLDRYLMSIGHPQIYGTQFEFNPSEKRYQLKLPVGEATMLPSEKELLGIPSINERLSQLNVRSKK
jgi:hypothetical protein